MLKITGRYIPDHVFPEDAVEPITGNMMFQTRNSKQNKAQIVAYTTACIIQYGAVEFKTLNEVEFYNEEE